MAERTDADLLRLIAKDYERLAPNAHHSAETLRQIAARLTTGASVSTAIPAGMKPWAGGDSAPEDWDGGRVLFRNGQRGQPPTTAFWRHFAGSESENGPLGRDDPRYDIIAYTPKIASEATAPGLREALEPFARLADDFDAASTAHLGVGLDGLLPETTLPVGGAAVSARCQITLSALIAARAALSVPPPPSAGNAGVLRGALEPLPSHPRANVRPAYTDTMVGLLDAYEQAIWKWAQGCEIDGINQRSAIGDSYNEGQRADACKARSALIQQIDLLTTEPALSPNIDSADKHTTHSLTEGQPANPQKSVGSGAQLVGAIDSADGGGEDHPCSNGGHCCCCGPYEPCCDCGEAMPSRACLGEKCWCGAPASKKVGEEVLFDDPTPDRHNLTSYVCATHYAQLMGPLGAKQVGLEQALAIPSQTGGGGRR